MDKMNLRISVTEKKAAEKLLCVLNIGLMHCIKTGILCIEEAENYLYSPYSMKKLEEANINAEIIDLIHLGCELENVERIIPDKLDKSIDEIISNAVKVLKEIPPVDLPSKKWIDSVD